MMICEPKRGFRRPEAADLRTKIEFARNMKRSAEIYPDAAVNRAALGSFLA